MAVCGPEEVLPSLLLPVHRSADPALHTVEEKVICTAGLVSLILSHSLKPKYFSSRVVRSLQIVVDVMQKNKTVQLLSV